MTFSVPVVLTISGWVKVEADSLSAAKSKAQKLNEDGVVFGDIEDSSASSECMLDEIEQQDPSV